jgi:hypothetical protein
VSTLPQLAADSLFIVVPGDYRPVQVTPRWLLDQGLIGQADFDTREVELLVPGEIAKFKVGAYQVQCQPGRLQVTTDDESEFERLRDLMSGILRALPDVKVSQLGINRAVHFYASGAASWHAIGDSLVNNEMWEDVLPLSGMRAVVFWCGRADKYAGRVQVQVEPSFRYANAVYVAYNDHYELTRVDAQPMTRDEAQSISANVTPEALAEKKPIALEVLGKNWRESMQRFADVVERIARQGTVTR